MRNTSVQAFKVTNHEEQNELLNQAVLQRKLAYNIETTSKQKNSQPKILEQKSKSNLLSGSIFHQVSRPIL